MQINEKVKKLRELHDITQESMAENLGISTNHYSRIERGKVKINIDFLEKVSAVLGMDLMDLLNYNDKTIICLINENGHHYAQNYAQYAQNYQPQNNHGNAVDETEMLKLKIENLETVIALKDELLQQKDGELAALRLLVKSHSED